MTIREFFSLFSNKPRKGDSDTWNIEDAREGEALLMQALVENDQDRKVELLLSAAEKGNHVAVRTLARMGHPAGQMADNNHYPYSVDSDIRLSDSLQKEVSSICVDERLLNGTSDDDYDSSELARENPGMVRGFEAYRRWIDHRSETDRDYAIHLFEENLPSRMFFLPKELEALVILAEYYRHRDKDKYYKYCLIGARSKQPLLAYAYAIIKKREGSIEEAIASLKVSINNGTGATAVAARFQFATLYMQSDEALSKFHDDALRYIREGIEAADRAISDYRDRIKSKSIGSERIKDEYFGFYILLGQFFLRDREKAVNEATRIDLTDKAVTAFEDAYNKINGLGPRQLLLVAAKELSRLLLLKGDTYNSDYYNKKCRELSQEEWA